MEYPRTNKEFEDYLANQIITIESMNLPEEQKKNLYGLVNETSTRYYELKKLDVSENLKKFANNLEKLMEGSKLIFDNFEIISKGAKYLHKIHEEVKNNLTEKNLGKN